MLIISHALIICDLCTELSAALVGVIELGVRNMLAEY